MFVGKENMGNISAEMELFCFRLYSKAWNSLPKPCRSEKQSWRVARNHKSTTISWNRVRQPKYRSIRLRIVVGHSTNYMDRSRQSVNWKGSFPRITVVLGISRENAEKSDSLFWKFRHKCSPSSCGDLSQIEKELRENGAWLVSVVRRQFSSSSVGIFSG